MTDSQFLETLNDMRDRWNGDAHIDGALTDARLLDGLEARTNKEALTDLLDTEVPTASGWLPSLPWVKK